MAECECKDKKHICARLHSDYGGGFHWFAKICEQCLCIVDNRMPFESSIDNGRYQFPISPVDYFTVFESPQEK